MDNTNTEGLLTHDHDDLDVILVELDRAFAEKNPSRSFDLLDLFWGRLAVHIRAENVHLFPTLMRVADRAPETASTTDTVTAQEIRDLVAQMLEDHSFFMRELIHAIKKLKVLRQQNESNGLEEIRLGIMPMRHRLEIHNGLEETRVYRQAELLLSAAEQAELSRNIQTEIDNLPERLQNLSYDPSKKPTS